MASDSFWTPVLKTKEQVLIDLAGTASCHMWRHLRADLDHYQGRIRAIELGCGMGKLSICLSLLGHDVTFFDSNRAALDQVHGFLQDLGIPHHTVFGDLHRLDPNLLGCFDISLSDGTIEHFQEDASRQQIVNAYFDVLRPGGRTLIGVPNAWGLFYRPVFATRRRLGLWPADVPEIPYSIRELRERAGRAGFTEIEVLGLTSLREDFFDWVWPSFLSLSRKLTGLPAKPAASGRRFGLDQVKDLAANPPAIERRPSLHFLSAGILLKAVRPGSRAAAREPANTA